MTNDNNDLKKIDKGDEQYLSPENSEFVSALRELLNAPAPQERGRTSRKVFLAAVVYHEDDFPLTDPSKVKADPSKEKVDPSKKGKF